VQGDERCHAIAAASIIAKVHRDRMMVAWDQFYPAYGLANHKAIIVRNIWRQSSPSDPRRCTA